MNTIIDTLLKFWLALLWAPKMSWPVLSPLLARGITLPELFSDTKTALSALGLSDETVKYLQSPNWRLVDRHLEWATQQANHSIIYLMDSAYPALLKEIHDPPLVLFIRGDVTLLREHQLAVVGSRKPTPSGRATALEFCKQLSTHGVVITSGMAHGIDTASHKGALAGGGHTIAVMGTGPDQIYPKLNQALSEQILTNGALVSEFPLGSPPLPNHFPRRNRIVTGLSLGTLIVEASIKSGTLISARLAMEQNREVFAIPGSIHSKTSTGCHELIKNGAKLTECIQDIIDEIPVLNSDNFHAPIDNNPKFSLDVDHKDLLECIGFEATDLDTILDRLNSNISEVSAKLLNLQLAGLISIVPGGYARAAI